MEQRLRDLIKTRQRQLGITTTEIVERMGYRNVSKGHRRLGGGLTGVGVPTGDQPERLAKALGLSVDQVRRAIQRAEETWQTERRAARLSDSNYYLYTRLIATIYPRTILPQSLSEKDALTLARAKARNLRLPCCLNTPSSRNYWINRDGDVYRVDEGRAPTTSVGGRQVTVNCR